MIGKYKVITLCGSTRFRDAFLQAQKILTLKGYIVISVGLFGHGGDAEVWEGMDEGTVTATKQMLDDMHKAKIDMADEIFVVNVDDYIGESTRSEIAYAKTHGKRVNYLEPHKVMYEDPTDCRKGADLPWERGKDQKDEHKDPDLDTLDAFIREAAAGPSGIYSPDSATAAMIAYQNGEEEDDLSNELHEEGITEEDAIRNYVLSMLQQGIDAENIAYFLQMDAEQVRRIADEMGKYRDENGYY